MMDEKQNKIDRRIFLKTIGAAGLAPTFIGVKSVFASEQKKSGTGEPNAIDLNAAGRTQKAEFPQVPKRKLGKTDIEVPCLALGTMFNVVENQLILRKAIQYGVTYWDTAHSYGNGNSELGIGKFLSKNPQVRKNLFLATKASGAQTTDDVENLLQTSLKLMNTDYIDLYYGVHILSNPAQLTDDLRKWAEDAKKRKLIRFFGFSTHSNMPQCLSAAAKLDWIDVIMTACNFRLVHNPEMYAAIEACHKAGIGLVAMKTQGKKVEDDEDRKLTEHFLKRGFTEGQAKVKAVLEDKRITTACVGRGDIAHFTQNIAAVMDQTKLTQRDLEVFKEYAQETCDGYCAGCAHICDSALPDTPYVREIMRYLMYYNSYGEPDTARELFAQIPSGVRDRLLRTDYSLAEARCPQRLPISRLVAEAVSKLA
jgi:predicted aldo/keto reductase-like oxidoreductase